MVDGSGPWSCLVGDRALNWGGLSHAQVSQSIDIGGILSKCKKGEICSQLYQVFVEQTYS